MKTILDSVVEFLEADGWPIHPVENQPAYSMTFQGEQGTWFCVAQANEEDRQFVFYSACPVEASPEVYTSVAELLTRINNILLTGNFEMNYLNGNVRFRTSIEMPGHELGAFLVQRIVYANVITMDTYLPALLNVIQNGVSPLEAISNALGSRG